MKKEIELKDIKSEAKDQQHERSTDSAKSKENELQPDPANSEHPTSPAKE